jgi:Flp pilus assembly protein TadD
MREAIEAFEQTGMQEVPDYVLAPIIRAYRDQKRFAGAERWARAGAKEDPLDLTYPKLLGLVLADQGHIADALAVLQPLTTTQPDDPEVWLALGYASQRAKDRFAILRNYGQALAKR